MAQRTDNAARTPAARLYLAGRPTGRQVLGSDWQVGRWPDMVPHAPRASVEPTPVLHLNSALPQCIPPRVVLPGLDLAFPSLLYGVIQQ